MHEFFGSSAYVRGAEVVLGLRRVRDGYARLHFFKDRDGGLPLGSSWGLLFDRERGFRRETQTRIERPSLTSDIASFLARVPCATQSEIEQNVTGKAEDVRAALTGGGFRLLTACLSSPRHHPNSKCWALPEGLVPAPGTRRDETCDGPPATSRPRFTTVPLRGTVNRDETERPSDETSRDETDDT